MTVLKFFDKYDNKGIDFDGYYGFQCMDLIEQYNNEVINAPRIGGNAIDVWNNYPEDFYDKIKNTPTNVPQTGDIIIWGQGVGQYGHIAIAWASDVNNFTSFDQNWPLGSLCHFQVHNYKYVLGWIHPNHLPSEPSSVIVPISGQTPTASPEAPQVPINTEPVVVTQSNPESVPVSSPTTIITNSPGANTNIPITATPTATISYIPSNYPPASDIPKPVQEKVAKVSFFRHLLNLFLKWFR